MEYEMCLVYEKGRECPGAGGRKLRHVCIYCPNYQTYLKRKDDENGNGNHDRRTCIDRCVRRFDLEQQEREQDGRSVDGRN